MLFLPPARDLVNFANHRLEEDLLVSNAKVPVDEFSLSCVASSRQEARTTTEESESGSVVSSTAGENNCYSSYYSAKSFAGEPKAATDVVDIEEERVGVTGDVHVDSTAREEEPGVEQMQKLVFGSLSTRVVAKQEFPTDQATSLLNEPNAGGKMGGTPKSNEAGSKKRKALREESAAGKRRSSRRLSTVLSKFSPHSLAKELDIGEVKQKSGRKESSEIEDTTVDFEAGDVFAGQGGVVNQRIVEEENEEVKLHKKKGGRKMSESVKVTPKRRPTIVEEMVPRSSGKKRRICKFGEDCQGCNAPECGECVQCLDK